MEMRTLGSTGLLVSSPSLGAAFVLDSGLGQRGATAIVKEALDAGINYSMLWREAEKGLIREAVRKGMGIMLGSPTQQGWLAHRCDRLQGPVQALRGALWMPIPRCEIYTCKATRARFPLGRNGRRPERSVKGR